MRSAESIDTIVIIGGGISGLSSAFYLRKMAKEQGRNIHIELVEAESRLGGKINTLHRDGFVIEKGPDSFLSRKLPIIELAHDLGIEQELVPTNKKAAKTYIMKNGKLHEMPKGLTLGIPTSILPFLATELVSGQGKLEALADLLKGPQPKAEDESLGGFLSRRIGNEIVSHIAEPLLAGIYAGDLHKLSLQATFPQFAQYEKEHGSIIMGSRYSRAQLAEQNKGKPPATFMTFKNGLSTMVEALEKELSDISIHTSTKVESLDKQEHGYALKLSNGNSLRADAVIVTTPARAANQLLQPHIKSTMLADMRYVSVANVVLAFDKASFDASFDGSGFLVPRSEGLRITACTWTSNKWLHSAPDDKVLLRCYVGHSEDQESVKLEDEALVAAVREDVEKAIGLQAEPIFSEITRLNHSMPQYAVGHLQAIQSMRIELNEKLPGVWVTGAAFHGVGLPDCIRQGKEAAELMLDFIQTQ
ncbi:protoporphyrinogen oxidase [Paenibacillus septentrionalis]|uniref:Coproporphyrinogen III oxidase n=1 Tax=Paenibacillus septentrionalis TaxID=429342 RepID=A0ABW1V510_9BACL